MHGCKQKTIAERIMLKTKAKLSLITRKCGEKRNTWTSFLIRDLCPFLGFRCLFKLNIIFCTCSFAFYDRRYPAVIVRGCKPVALILFQKPNGAKKKQYQRGSCWKRKQNYHWSRENAGRRETPEHLFWFAILFSFSTNHPLLFGSKMIL